MEPWRRQRSARRGQSAESRSAAPPRRPATRSLDRHRFRQLAVGRSDARRELRKLDDHRSAGDGARSRRSFSATNGSSSASRARISSWARATRSSGDLLGWAMSCSLRVIYTRGLIDSAKLEVLPTPVVTASPTMAPEAGHPPWPTPSEAAKVSQASRLDHTRCPRRLEDGERHQR